MNLFTWANKRVKLLNWFDMKLLGLAGAAIGSLLAIWLPGLLKVNIWVYVIIAVLGCFRVFYVIYFKKS